MSHKLQKQYRLKNHDYSSNATYFVTICTKDKENIFGEIKDDIINLSEVGKIVSEFWMKIPEHYPFVILDEFTVMPNHIHGVIIICNRRNAPWRVPTEIQPLQINSLSSIINHYKGSITTHCRKNNLARNIWQPRFHDRIIRSDKELTNVRKYIYDNVINWKKDKYF